MIRLPRLDYIVTGEGETEVCYFEHLKHLINKEECKKCVVVYEPKKCQFPYSHAKSQTVVFDKKWYHILDRESLQDGDTASFETRLKNFRDVKTIKKSAKLVLGYCNVSFELWLILHKQNSVAPVHKAKDYWKTLKRVYHLDDISQFDKYKGKKNFQKVLSQITLEDVKRAIKNAEKLEEENRQSRCEYKQVSSFEYCVSNPSLSVHKIVKEILEDAGLL